jgi:hypothetical protein
MSLNVHREQKLSEAREFNPKLYPSLCFDLDFPFLAMSCLKEKVVDGYSDFKRDLLNTVQGARKSEVLI